MKKVIILKGLPGSGKSTVAKKMMQELPGAYKRINKDELRAMLDHSHHSDANEKFVLRIRDMLITQALKDGKHVLIDDTNLAEKHEQRIRQLVNEFNKENNDQVSVEVILIDTPVDECIERDARRDKPVGEKVIRQMYHQFFNDGCKTAVQDISLPRAIVCDLDGTLARLNGRNPYDATTCDNDLLNEAVAHVLKTYRTTGYKILLVSGRKDNCRPQTEKWLAQHNIGYDMLVMRPSNDMQKDSTLKLSIYNDRIRDHYYVEFVLDDRNQVVDTWRREIGLTCFQVNYGDF